MTLIAKPVVDKEFWILQENNIKIGNVLAHAGRYQVKINNRVTEYQSLDKVESAIGITLTSAKKSLVTTTIRGYHTGPEAFNQVWDVEQSLPLFTKVESGQCWYAAGWYKMKRGNKWMIEECPKLIFLQRNEYQGPYLTKGEAENALISLRRPT